MRRSVRRDLWAFRRIEPQFRATMDLVEEIGFDLLNTRRPNRPRPQTPCPPPGQDSE